MEAKDGREKNNLVPRQFNFYGFAVLCRLKLATANFNLDEALGMFLLPRPEVFEVKERERRRTNHNDYEIHDSQTIHLSHPCLKQIERNSYSDEKSDFRAIVAESRKVVKSFGVHKHRFLSERKVFVKIIIHNNYGERLKYRDGINRGLRVLSIVGDRKDPKWGF